MMDFILIAGLGVGLIAMYFYFKESGGGGNGGGNPCAGTAGNCVYNKCKRDYCWRGLIGVGTPNEDLVQVCRVGLPSATTITQGCQLARTKFLYCVSSAARAKECGVVFGPV